MNNNICSTGSTKHCWLEAGTLQLFILKVFIRLMLYRKPMVVKNIVVFSSAWGETGYYRCPRCRITLDREFVSFCDRCGQRLDWSEYTEATVEKAGSRRFK